MYYARIQDFEQAKENLQSLKEIFGDNLYFLLEKHEVFESGDEELEMVGFLSEQEAMNHLINIAKDLDIKIIASNNSLYARESDRINYRLFRNSFGEFTGPFTDFGFSTDNHHICTEDELKERLENSYGKEIAEESFNNLKGLEKFLLNCNVQFPDAPNLIDNSQELWKLCEEGFNKIRKGTKYEEESDKRWKYEFEVINGKNFTQYFIKVYNICKVAKELGILVGPGRGSGAGSEICYLVGITQVDPLRYGLYFERFLNPSRNGFPDIDLDLATVPISREVGV